MRTIPLGPKTADSIAELVQATDKRKKNWTEPKASSLRIAPRYNTIDCGRYSSRCTYRKYNYMPVVGSYAIIEGGLLHYFWSDEEPTVLEAPFGYIWSEDVNGICIISNDGKKDYHPTSDDLREYSKRHIRSLALANYRTRVRIKREAYKELRFIKKAQKEGARICLKDSLIAGNCRVGTEDFGKRHQLDPSKHYSPNKLLKIANGAASRVKLAVMAGLRRHRSEMKAGMCMLYDHLDGYNRVFEELSDVAKERALRKNYDWNIHDEWYYFVYDMWKEKLEAIGFEDAEIFFSGFSSQGDGACFDADINLDKLTNCMFYAATTYKEAKYWRAINIAVDRDLICGGSIYSVGNYSHENSRGFSIPEIYLQDVPVVDEFEKLLEQIDELRCTLSQEIYSSLSSEYDYLTSDEAIKESLIANECEFNDREDMI